MKALPARKLATKNYYGHDGAFFPETMSFWGNYLDQGDLGYGINRAGKPDGLTDNDYIRRYWQGGLEMVAMMLDYYDLTQDAKFRDDTLLPFATRNHRLLRPALETRRRRQDPVPPGAVAGNLVGLHQPAAGDRRPALRHPAPASAAPATGPTKLPGRRRSTICRPSRSARRQDGRSPSAAGREVRPKAELSRTPSFTPCFPTGFTRSPPAAMPSTSAKATFAARRHPENGGWQQNAIQAALLGLADEAAPVMWSHSASSVAPAVSVSRPCGGRTTTGRPTRTTAA